MTVQNCVKIVWTVFVKFEIFMKRSGEKKQKKQHDCLSSRNIFPTPKNMLTSSNKSSSIHYGCISTHFIDL